MSARITFSRINRSASPRPKPIRSSGNQRRRPTRLIGRPAPKVRNPARRQTRPAGRPVRKVRRPMRKPVRLNASPAPAQPRAADRRSKALQPPRAAAAGKLRRSEAVSAPAGFQAIRAAQPRNPRVKEGAGVFPPAAAAAAVKVAAAAGDSEQHQADKNSYF